MVSYWSHAIIILGINYHILTIHPQNLSLFCWVLGMFWPIRESRRFANRLTDWWFGQPIQQSYNWVVKILTNSVGILGLLISNLDILVCVLTQLYS